LPHSLESTFSSPALESFLGGETAGEVNGNDVKDDNNNNNGNAGDDAIENKEVSKVSRMHVEPRVLSNVFVETRRTRIVPPPSGDDSQQQRKVFLFLLDEQQERKRQGEEDEQVEQEEGEERSNQLVESTSKEAEEAEDGDMKSRGARLLPKTDFLRLENRKKNSWKSKEMLMQEQQRHQQQQQQQQQQQSSMTTRRERLTLPLLTTLESRGSNSLVKLDPSIEDLLKKTSSSSGASATTPTSEAAKEAHARAVLNQMARESFFLGSPVTKETSIDAHLPQAGQTSSCLYFPLPLNFPLLSL